MFLISSYPSASHTLKSRNLGPVLLPRALPKLRPKSDVSEERKPGIGGPASKGKTGSRDGWGGQSQRVAQIQPHSPPCTCFPEGFSQLT